MAESFPIAKIRNFAIIAHIDHGKSTLADRFIELCGALSDREMSAQVLDDMELERERGITIKARSVTLRYQGQDGEVYRLNLIDTPGHVDFSYEVSRSLAACEGGLLVVDASQGVEAQTVANCYSALEQDLVILPVLNKMDLPQADAARASEEIEDIVGLDATDALQISAKTGLNVPEVLERVVRDIPPPADAAAAPLQALIIDSWFDSYIGVVSLVRVFAGRLRRGDRIRVMSTGQAHRVESLGWYSPHRESGEALDCGQVGYVAAGIRDIEGAPVGDTVTHAADGAEAALPGFKATQPKVFSGLFPVDADDYEQLRDALGKLRLNDASFHYEPETSKALGFGFRCGFLGLLHMEIVQERLEREYRLNLLSTAPTVACQVQLKSGEVLETGNPSQLPEPPKIEEIREPYIEANILVPQAHIGAVIALCEERRGRQVRLQYSRNQVSLTYRLPLAETVTGFYDRLKSVSRGYASLDYQLSHFEAAPLVKLDMLVNGERVDALSVIVHQSRAMGLGRDLAERMKDLIPRQMFDVAVQAAIGSRIIARTTVKALRKNVTAKCYGGDITRKRKLLEKQKAGKKRMKRVGNVDIPQEAFMAILKME